MVTTAPPAGATLRPRRGEETTAGVRVACLIVALDGQQPLDLPSRHWLAEAGEVVLGRMTVPAHFPPICVTLSDAGCGFQGCPRGDCR